MAKTERPFVPAGFFSFRTPLLPFEELEAFGEGLEAPAALASGAEGENPERLEAALAADRERLRALARDLGLLVTGSSDYHGQNKTTPIAAETTRPEVADALVARATGAAVVTGEL